jgi:glutamate N-acetyltransferase/amino-acid N-acetyltransferase
MGKKTAKIKQLRKKLKKAKQKLHNMAPAVLAPAVSPLAPEGGFPDLPVIKGVRFAAGSAGVKSGRPGERDDVMLAEIASGSSIAGVFTRSATRSAPVLDCQAKLARISGAAEGKIGIVVNSGNANAFTGAHGQGSVEAVTEAAANAIGTGRDLVFSASTGVIGEPLPHDRIVAVLDTLAEKLSEDQAEAAARATMTTDTFPKGAAAECQVGDETVRIAGFAKGSGMIAPDMATMLVHIFTDAAIDQPVLQQLLSELTGPTFNAITVDSDTSTSDALLLVATGQAGNTRITDVAEAGAFREALQSVMLDLAHQVVRDGEGASKFIEVSVTGAESDTAAHRVGLSIANSPLVKTAFAGEDPNWGRIVMAVGKSGEFADRDRLTIRFGDILVAEKGWVASGYSEEAGAAYMKNSDLQVFVDLGVGVGSATVWTCDLTHQYITINADYRS